MSSLDNRQKSLDHYVAPAVRHCSTARSQALTSVIADMVSKDLLPLSVVDGTGFAQLMEFVEPEYRLPGRMTITRTLEKRYEESRTSLREELKKARQVAITTDGWTSNTTESYCTITCHYTKLDQFRLKSVVLQTRALSERHTAENLADVLKKSVDEWGLTGKVLACVHDNAQNIVVANSHKYVAWESWPCFAHTLQLAVHDGMKRAGVDDVIVSCNRLVAHFHHSTLAVKNLKDKQRLLDLPTHKLIVSCPTRWNSVCDMFKRLFEQRAAISSVLSDRNMTKLNDERKLALQDREWQLIEEILPVLEALKCATTALSGDSSVSISAVYPVAYGLMNNHLKPLDDDSPMVQTFKTEVNESLRVRLNVGERSICQKLPVIAAFFDPRHKHLPFLSDITRVETKQFVYNLLSGDGGIVEESTESTRQASTQPVAVSTDEHRYAKKPRKSLDCERVSAMEALLGQQYGRQPESFRSTEDLESQFGAYCREQTQPLDVDALQWWYQNRERYSRLVNMAISYLSVPATSVPSERVGNNK